MVPLVGIMFSNIVMGVTNYLAYKYEMTQALSSCWSVIFPPSFVGGMSLSG